MFLWTWTTDLGYANVDVDDRPRVCGRARGRRSASCCPAAVRRAPASRPSARSRSSPSSRRRAAPSAAGGRQVAPPASRRPPRRRPAPPPPAASATTRCRAWSRLVENAELSSAGFIIQSDSHYILVWVRGNRASVRVRFYGHV